MRCQWNCFWEKNKEKNIPFKQKKIENIFFSVKGKNAVQNIQKICPS